MRTACERQSDVSIERVSVLNELSVTNLHQKFWKMYLGFLSSLLLVFLTNINLLTIHKNAKREAKYVAAYVYTYIHDEIWYECMRIYKKWFIINRYCHFGLEKAHDGSVNINIFMQKCAGAHVCRYDANITHIHTYISMSKSMYTHIRMYLHIICDLLNIFKYIYLFSHVWHEGR